MVWSKEKPMARTFSIGVIAAIVLGVTVNTDLLGHIPCAAYAAVAATASSGGIDAGGIRANAPDDDSLRGAARGPRSVRPVHTFSIVARDPKTGEMGVAVQSHYFS